MSFIGGLYLGQVSEPSLDSCINAGNVSVSVSNFATSSNVNIFSSNGGSLSNTSGGLNTYDITLPTVITNSNLQCNITNTSALLVSDAILESAIYDGVTPGTTNMGVLINNSLPISTTDTNIADVVAGTSNLGVIINNSATIGVNDMILEGCVAYGTTPSSANLSVIVENITAIPVNDSYLASLTYNSGNVNVFDGNLASTINTGNVNVLVNNTNNIAVADAVLDGCVISGNVSVYDSAANTKLQTIIDQTLLNGGVLWNAATVANNAFSNVVDFSTKNAIIYSFFGNVAPVNLDNAIVLTAYFSGDGANFYKSDINISPLDLIVFDNTASDFCTSIACGAGYVKLQVTGLTGDCVITAIINHS